MSQIINDLRDWGCDVNSAMERMLDDEEFYIECLNTIPSDPDFALLKKALHERNTSAAFDSAHTLKGVIANLGLTPMYKTVVEIVEPLRAGHCDNLDGKMDELEKKRDHLAQILQQP